MDSTEFHRYFMDCIKYSVNIDLVNQQLSYLRAMNDSLELTPSQLNAKIKEKDDRVAQLTKDIAEKQNVLLELKNDLRSLQFNGTRSVCERKVQEDAVESTHKTPIVNSANELAAQSTLLETRLGFKLKLTECEEGNQKIVRAKFVFDPNSAESSKYVVFGVDVAGSSFSLIDMEPMPPQFRKMQQFLVDTNDVTGLLASCYKYFNSR